MNVTELHTCNTYSFDHTTKKRKCWNETKKIIIFVVDVGNVMPCNLAFFYDDRQTYWGPWESKFRKNKIRIFELQFTSLNVCFNGYTPFIRMSCNCKCSIRRTFRLGTMPSMYGKNTLLSSSMHGNLIAIHFFSFFNTKPIFMSICICRNEIIMFFSEVYEWRKNAKIMW